MVSFKTIYERGVCGFSTLLFGLVVSVFVLVKIVISGVVEIIEIG